MTLENNVPMAFPAVGHHVTVESYLRMAFPVAS